MSGWPSRSDRSFSVSWPWYSFRCSIRSLTISSLRASGKLVSRDREGPHVSQGVQFGLESDALGLGLSVLGGQGVDLLGDHVFVLVGEQHRILSLAEIHQQIFDFHLGAQWVEPRLDDLVDLCGAEAVLDVGGGVLLDVDVEPLGEGLCCRPS